MKLLTKTLNFIKDINRLDLLISLYVGAICMAELMGGKIFHVSSNILLFGKPLGTSVAVFLIPFIFSINDIIIEVYGKKRMLSIARSGLVTIAMILLFSTFAIWLPTADRSFISAEVYRDVFGVTQRIAFASLTAFGISIITDIVIFARIREKLSKYGLWFRNNLSNLLSQFVDTTIFMYFAYFSFSSQNHTNLWSLIIPYWIYKCTISFIITPLVYLGVKWLKNGKEELDVD